VEFFGDLQHDSSEPTQVNIDYFRVSLYL